MKEGCPIPNPNPNRNPDPNPNPTTLTPTLTPTLTLTLTRRARAAGPRSIWAMRAACRTGWPRRRRARRRGVTAACYAAWTGRCERQCTRRYGKWRDLITFNPGPSPVSGLCPFRNIRKDRQNFHLEQARSELTPPGRNLLVGGSVSVAVGDGVGG